MDRQSRSRKRTSVKERYVHDWIRSRMPGSLAVCRQGGRFCRGRSIGRWGQLTRIFTTPGRTKNCRKLEQSDEWRSWKNLAQRELLDEYRDACGMGEFSRTPSKQPGRPVAITSLGHGRVSSVGGNLNRGD